MSIEVEKKYRLTASERRLIAESLKNSGARFVRADFETNELYAGGILDEENAVLRVRKIEGATILTYKKRTESDSAIKRQIEYETEIGDRAAIEKIIESLGYKKAIVYEKWRETWILGDAEIVLDELAFGLFMEIEGEPFEIERVEKLIGAENLQAEHETYPRLAEKFGVRNGSVVEAKLVRKFS